MTAGGEPTRWLDAGSGAPSELRAVLESAAEPGDGARLARIEASLATALAASAAATAASSASTATAATGLKAALSLKVAGIAVATAGLVAGGVWIATREPIRAPTSVHPARSAPAQVPSAAQTELQPVAAVGASGDAIVSTQQPPRTQPPPHERSRDALAEEVRLLGAMQHAVAADPAKVLELAARHRQRFARGALAEERDVFEIEALSALGRAREARAKARAFLHAHPGSTHSARVAEALRSR